MPHNLKDILSNLSPDVDQETLMLYLQDKLSADKKHEVEKMLLDSDFDDDALEGLQAIANKQEIGLMVEQLNRDLKNKLEKKKKRRKRLDLQEQPWLYLSLVIILLLIIIGYIVVRRMLLHP